MYKNEEGHLHGHAKRVKPNIKILHRLRIVSVRHWLQNVKALTETQNKV